MKIEYRKWYSRNLQRDMEYKVYGHAGKPAIVFPTANGRYFQYEDSGMINALAPHLESGRLQMWVIDGVDGEALLDKNPGHSPEQRIGRHDAYFRYVYDELMPGVRHEAGSVNGRDRKLLVTGCSMGAFHSANFFFRYPWHIDSVIALSGVYSTRHCFGEHRDKDIYLNSPIHYLPNLTDSAYLDEYRRSRLIFCVGQGPYEDSMIAETKELAQILSSKQIPAWIDIWGTDVNHDWPWWHKQIDYFIGSVLED
jgi:esterase/lipase superfamily enzyme